MQAVFKTRTIQALRVPPGRDSSTFSQKGIYGLQLRVWWRNEAVRDLSHASTESYRHQWLFRYRLADNRSRIIHLGNWPEISPEDAIAYARHYRDLVKVGEDPKAAHLIERADRIKSVDVISAAPPRYRIENVLARFRESWAESGRSWQTFEKYEKTIETYILASMRGTDIRTITASRWERIVNRLANIDAKRGAAANLHKAGRRLFSFAKKSGLVDENPLLGMDDVLRSVRLAPDTRFLDSQELHKLLNELDSQPIPSWAKAQLELMLRCGGRVQEWQRIRIAWINFPKTRIELPGEAMKNRRGAWIHLPAPALDILIDWLAELKAQHGRIVREWYLFGDLANPSRPQQKDLSAATRQARGWLNFTPKMLRKTISTQLQRKGCPPAVLRAIRNQVITQGVEAHYDFDDLFHLKVEWLEKWGEYLDQVKEDPAALIPEKESKISAKHAGRVARLFD